jgi:hypothetical protein
MDHSIDDDRSGHNIVPSQQKIQYLVQRSQFITNDHTLRTNQVHPTT